ncbi:MAG: hypothetical protein IPJ21_11335 [Sterolibacteriaceae bacterium]|nr:hypothetical protein [Sterolibacteriaceae bacterium]MBK9084448.1 hypothetical protein [Sterolibacteriaceae bacterium]
MATMSSRAASSVSTTFRSMIDRIRCHQGIR